MAAICSPPATLCGIPGIEIVHREPTAPVVRRKPASKSSNRNVEFYILCLIGLWSTSAICAETALQMLNLFLMAIVPGFQWAQLRDQDRDIFSFVVLTFVTLLQGEIIVLLGLRQAGKVSFQERLIKVSFALLWAQGIQFLLWAFILAISYVFHEYFFLSWPTLVVVVVVWL